MGKSYNSAVARGEKLDQISRLSEVRIVSVICHKKHERRSVVEPPSITRHLG